MAKTDATHEDRREDPARELSRLLTRLDLRVAREALGRVVALKVAARLLGISRRSAAELIIEGQLPATPVGKDWVVRLADLRRFERRRRAPGRPRKGPGRPRKR